MLHAPPPKKKKRHTLHLPYTRIDKFLFSTFKSTQMGMELNKPKKNKTYEKLCHTTGSTAESEGDYCEQNNSDYQV